MQGAPQSAELQVQQAHVRPARNAQARLLHDHARVPAVEPLLRVVRDTPNERIHLHAGSGEGKCLTTINRVVMKQGYRCACLASCLS